MSYSWQIKLSHVNTTQNRKLIQRLYTEISKGNRSASSQSQAPEGMRLHGSKRDQSNGRVKPPSKRPQGLTARQVFYIKNQLCHVPICGFISHKQKRDGRTKQGSSSCSRNVWTPRGRYSVLPLPRGVEENEGSPESTRRFQHPLYYKVISFLHTRL